MYGLFAQIQELYKICGFEQKDRTWLFISFYKGTCFFFQIKIWVMTPTQYQNDGNRIHNSINMISILHGRHDPDFDLKKNKFLCKLK